MIRRGDRGGVTRRQFIAAGGAAFAVACNPIQRTARDPFENGADSMYDVVIVGGSYAGLAAAMQLGRARRSVVVVDDGQRRNRYVSRAHGILGFDGESPAVIAAKGKDQVLAYPSIRWLDGAVTETRASPDGFMVSAGNEHVRSKRLILATGVVDDIPSIPGVRERWGKTVFHCPYCDGYELDRRQLGVLAEGPFAMHYAAIVAEWGMPRGPLFRPPSLRSWGPVGSMSRPGRRCLVCLPAVTRLSL